jgi:ferredoxin
VDPRKVAHVRKAAERGLGKLDGFEVLGERVEDVAVRFSVPATPKVNRFFISGVILKLWTALANPLARMRGKTPVTYGGVTGEVKVIADKCDACAVCVKACPVEAIAMRDKLPVVDAGKCILCFCCAEACPVGALEKG